MRPAWAGRVLTRTCRETGNVLAESVERRDTTNNCVRTNRCEMVRVLKNRGSGSFTASETPNPTQRGNAVQTHSNLSTSRQKSSPVIRRKSDRALLSAKCVVTKRELAEVGQLRAELRILVDRFDEKLWQIEHRGCRR